MARTAINVCGGNFGSRRHLLWSHTFQARSVGTCFVLLAVTQRENEERAMDLNAGGVPGGEISIEYLADHPELADELATWSWTEWRQFFDARGRTFSDAQRSYRERAQTDALPMALVAFADGKLVGTVSLLVHDLPTRTKITPWLGSLFVVPALRGRGIASLLIGRARAEARRLHLPTLFLWTSSAEALYLQLGWRTVEETEYCAKRIVIMQAEAAPNGPVSEQN